MRTAAIDIGTNSIRLLVADVFVHENECKLNTLSRLMVITRLGEGVDGRGYLDREAIARTTAVLRRYREQVESQGAERWEVVATSAAREADNADEFIEAVRTITGREPRLISGEEEARLTFLGATYDLGALCPIGQAVAVVDIGGGSTEIIVGANGTISHCYSLDIGCVRMSERFLASDPPRRGELEDMENHIMSVISPYREEISTHSAALTVGTAGTVTTLSGIKQGLSSYVGEAIHHSWLTREEVEELYRRLREAPLERRRSLMRLEPERADVIVGGTGVLVVLLREMGWERVLVSEKDILDGLAITAALGGGL
jgi:exopolyphosphatase/guanosine-5'-triphosphate,3'-diphosphate pyrophosphatase